MGKRSAYYTTVPAQEGEKKEKSVQTMGERWRLLCSEGLGNRHIQEARASVGGQTSTQTSRGVSRDGGGGGRPRPMQPAHSMFLLAWVFEGAG